ncbi:hypothetical protein [Mycolicibacterium fortuitum]|uniref:Uncharacterized protein n=2 Tax=Mycolicibacterium fortuitum TaxID=1766 RepID=A0AAE5AEQ7_MYCFO|nr:hypothetical protein [Mycolicibacterium fortuitum]MCV7143593.1 hypothetical protein [Mycolicibacterium fortuitum]MDV7193158.1 hypothetical protein [Mycolicibacterium fortuitum]MDV7206463.1 hypothetical protein [Mycolicibacterium fortuitum]MDV7227990.1 hypothetical protein [Mycolicibacterium fortuitum]MDV7260364.1 hypothetical protein [Mycolicibacterium fortuitum]
MTTTTDRIIAAANAVRTTHLAALRPLAEVAGRTVAAPPTVEAALAAALHLIAARPALDHAITELLRELVAAGISSTKLARLMSIRHSTLTDRLAAPAPAAQAMPELHYGMFRRKDKVSIRAARESLIGAARDLGRTYASALRPISTVSQGSVPEAATVDAALEAVLHLHRSRAALDAALDPVLACLVLGGVRRMSLAEALDVHPNTLQRRLMGQPLAHARHADLVDEGEGKWSVAPAEVGRYKPADPELEPALVEAAVAEAITAVAENGPSARAREYSATVAESRVAF